MDEAPQHPVRSRALFAALAAACVAALLVAFGGPTRPPDAGASGSPGTTVLNLSASIPSVAVGGTVTFSATLQGESPTGSVTFLENGEPLSCGGGATVSVSSGAEATCSIASLPTESPLGFNAVSALYGGDDANLPASAWLDEDFLPSPTTTSLAASPTTASLGQAVTYSATVESVSGAVSSGTVTFTDDGQPIVSCGGASGVAPSSGVATCTLTDGYDVAGAHAIDAVFEPAATTGLAVSTATPLVEEVAESAAASTSSVSLVASSSNPPVDSAVSFAAVVSDGTGATAPSGTVSFLADGSALTECTDLAVSAVDGSGQADVSCSDTTGFTSAGAVDIDAVFVPDASSDLTPSVAGQSVLTVDPGSATITLGASPDPSTVGQSVTLSATATANGPGSLDGASIVFDDGAGVASCGGGSGIVAANAGGATCTVTAASAGESLYSATLLATGSLESASVAVPSSIASATTAPSVVVTASPDPALLSTGVTYTATISGAGTDPSGMVSFNSLNASDQPISGCAAVAVVASAAACSVPAGYSTSTPQVVTATFISATSSVSATGAMSEPVAPAGSPTLSNLVLSVAPTPVAMNESVTFTATVTSTGGTPTGAVAFTEDGSSIPNCGAIGLSELSSDTAEATCTLTSGYDNDLDHVVVASYGGDATDDPASAAMTVAAAPELASGVLTMTPSPPVVGSPAELEVSLGGLDGSPSGNVAIVADGAASSCGGAADPDLTLSGSGFAYCALTSSASASQDVAAAFPGDDYYGPAEFGLGDETASTGSEPPSLLVDAGSSLAVGDDVTYVATVSGSDGAPTGSVTLSDGGTALTSCGTDGVIELSSGTASCDVGTSLPAGAHELVASYSGDDTYAPSTVLLTVPVSDPSSPGGGSPGGGSPPGSGGSPGGGGGAPDGGGSSAPTGTATTVTAPPPPTTTTLPAKTPGKASPSGSSSSGSKSTMGSPTLSVTAPRVSHPDHTVVYKARLVGTNGPVGGNVTFSVNGTPVKGCTRVSLGSAPSLEVTCTLAGGFATPGNRIVALAFSGSAHYRQMSTHLVERVLPDWSGYWIISDKGTLVAYGKAPTVTSGASSTASKAGSTVAAAAMDPDANGAWLLSRSGRVTRVGSAGLYGSARSSNGVFSGIAPTVDGKGYWLLARSGTVLSFGDAKSHGSARVTSSSGPFVAIEQTPDGGGYWLLSQNGTVVAKGDAQLEKGPTTTKAERPFVALSSSSDGEGYWLLSSKGRVLDYGDAPHLGMLHQHDARAIGLLPSATRRGYWLLEANGIVAHFGDAASFADPKPAPSSTALPAAIAGT